MRTFLFCLLIPSMCFSSDMRDFCEKKISTLEFLSFQRRNELGNEDRAYWYMCGRIDSYYELLCYDANPDLFQNLYDLPSIRGEEYPDDNP